MSGKVVNLHGHPIKHSIEPDVAVVKMLKDLLERAERGNITGIAVAVHFNDETSGQSYAGTHSYSVVGRLHSLQAAILGELQK